TAEPARRSEDSGGYTCRARPWRLPARPSRRFPPHTPTREQGETRPPRSAPAEWYSRLPTRAPGLPLSLRFPCGSASTVQGTGMVTAWPDSRNSAEGWGSDGRPHEGARDHVTQVIPIDGLGQDFRDDPGVQPDEAGRVGYRRDEDHGQVLPGSQEVAIQLGPAHAAQLDVEDEAAEGVGSTPGEELLGGREGSGGVARSDEQPDERPAHGRIVIDQAYDATT